MGYLRFYLAPKIEEDEEMGGHQAEPQVETKKQPEKKPKTEPNTNGEPPKRRVMKIDLDDEEEDLKPKIVTDPKSNDDYVEVIGSKPGTGLVKPKEEVNGDEEVKPTIEKETNGEAEVMDVE